jgi:hypothetical protein
MPSLIPCPGLDDPGAAWPDGWSPEARQVLERAAARHGGWERWRTLGTVRLEVAALGGPLPWAKGLGRTFPRPSTVEVTPRQGRTRFLDYPRAGLSGHFHAGDVSLVDDTTGAVEAASRDHRLTFAGLGAWRRWEPLDGLYFFGYALCTYLGLPFLLRGTRLVGTPRWRKGGVEHPGLSVEFPAGYHTHSPRQTFYFDPDGLLVRHDYVAEVVSGLARGAHFSGDHVEVDGLPFATRRWVVAAPFGRPSPVPVLEARLQGFRLLP